MRVSIHEIAHIRKIDYLHIDILALNNLQFHVRQLKILVIDIFIVIENSIPIDIHHIHGTLSFITREKTLRLLTILLSETNAIVLSLNPTPQINSTVDIMILHTGLHQDFVHDLRLHLKNLLVIYCQIALKFLTTTLNTFQSRKPNLKLICIPLKW